MKIAAAYIRVSTEEQTELSPDSQIKLIRDYAKAHEYIVPEEYIYRDNGISGRKTKNRPAFNEMIGRAKQKSCPFEAILVWKFSRFARNREDSIVYKSMLKKQNIDVISISEPVGDDKMSVLIEAMIEAMDEYYSLNLSEEASRGMLEKLSRGMCVNSAPIGYYFKDGELQIDEEKANLVRRLYAEYLDGKPIIAIARELNSEGILSPKNRKWTNRTVEYVLRNPLYAGKLRYTKGGGGSKCHYNKNLDILIVPGIHPPIISPEQWEQAQAKIQAQKAKYKKYERQATNKHMYALYGLVKCSTCGRSLTYIPTKPPSLQCCGYTHGLCHVSHSVSLQKITAAVVESIKAADMDREVLISPRKLTSISYQDDTEKRIQREYSKLQRIKEAYAAGIDTLEEYKEQKAKISAEIEVLKAKLPPAPTEQDPRTQLKAHRERFLDLLTSSDTSQEALNAALREFIDKIVYDKASESITIFYCV